MNDNINSNMNNMNDNINNNNKNMNNMNDNMYNNMNNMSFLWHTVAEQRGGGTFTVTAISLANVFLLHPDIFGPGRQYPLLAQSGPV